MRILKCKKVLSLLMVLILIFLQLPGLVLSASAAMPVFSGTSITDDCFYIENAEVGKFMQVDNDDDPNYNTNGSIMELWDYDGRNMQRWRIIARGNGYYQIANAQSGLSLAVQQGYENRSGKALVQEPYTGNDRQLWAITKTSRNTYVIRPFSARNYSTDWCMCAGSQFLGFTDGLNVEQKEYDNDNSLKDEWIFRQVYDASLLGFDEGLGVDRSAYFASTSDSFTRIGRDNIYREYYTYYTEDDMIESMQRSTVFYLQTHAEYDRIQIARDEPKELMKEDLEGVDLGQLEFALLLTCRTAYGGYNPNRVAANTPANIVEQLVCCGVETVIGFSGYTGVVQSNQYAILITAYICVNGYSVQEAVDRAAGLNGYFYTDIAQLAVIGGNPNKTLPPQ